MLEVKDLSARYGAVEALRDVSLTIAGGEIVSLIGANGAGKSTLMMAICGQAARTGSVRLDGVSLDDVPAHGIARRGIALVPEGRRIFPALTVFENLQLGAVPAAGGDFAADLARVYDLFPRLQERKAQRGGTLSGGEQQMLAIGRALMGRPRLLLLDEPSLGLAPLVVRQIFAVLKDLNQQTGLTIFLVEQNAHLALRLANRGYVMVNGRITLTGDAAALRANPDIRAAYLEGAA